VAKGRILVVDDEIYIVHILDFSFQMEGYEVTTALNGEEALARVKENRPDLIVMDTLMPRMDGHDACRALKADEETKDIPVVFLSPRDRDADRQKAFEIGVEDFVTKPFSPRKLVERVTAILATRRPTAS
jgi:two-component system alkaline phosphatase synthesis response regulator PhoP